MRVQVDRFAELCFIFASSGEKERPHVVHVCLRGLRLEVRCVRRARQREKRRFAESPLGITKSTHESPRRLTLSVVANGQNTSFF
jgi:hypothetical protein